MDPEDEARERHEHRPGQGGADGPAAESVPMGVVRIGHVGDAHAAAARAGAVAVLARRSGMGQNVHVVVVPVVVAVRVFVLQRLVLVLVPCDSARCSTTPASISTLPSAIRPLADRSPSATANAAPMKGAKANTEPVRAAPKARCASR
jgi:hypothetical protein